MFSFLGLPESPLPSAPIEAGPETTPRQLVVRAMFAVNRLTLPAAVLMIVQQVGQAAVPVVMGAAIDRALGGENLGALVLWVSVLAGLFLALGVSYRLAFRLEIMAMQLVCYRLRQRVAARVLNAQGGPRSLPGAALSIFTADVNRVGTAPSLLVYPVGELAAIVFVAIVLFTISWPLGLVVVMGTPLMIVMMDRAGGPMRRRTRLQQESIGNATGAVSDLLAGLRVLKGLGAERAAADRYRRTSQEALEATLRANSARAMFSGTTDVVVGLYIALVAVLIALFALRGDLSVGELIAVVGLTQFVLGPVQSLSKEFGVNWAQALGSAERVLGILQTRPASTAGIGILDPAVPPTLRMAGVVASPLDQLDLTLRAGECLGVVTDGGTAFVLAEILGRRRSMDAGTITLDGSGLSALRRDVVDGALLVPPHAADLFDGTILENVCSSRDVVCRSRAALARRALTAAECDEMIAGFAEGVETRVGEAGRRLSGGQRQRVALARALAAEAPVLVLHEPTTAVDSVTEASIAGSLRKFRANLSTLVISTSPPMLAVVDRVLWIRDGRVFAEGHHRDLMRDAEYAAVFE